MAKLSILYKSGNEKTFQISDYSVSDLSKHFERTRDVMLKKINGILAFDRTEESSTKVIDRILIDCAEISQLRIYEDDEDGEKANENAKSAEKGVAS